MQHRLKEISCRKTLTKPATVNREFSLLGSGRRVSARNVQRDFRKACRKAGIEDFVFHDLRHTFGTWLAQNGVDIYTIARYMGHEDLESTKRYTHHNAESLRVSIGTIEKMTGALKAIVGRQSHDA